MAQHIHDLFIQANYVTCMECDFYLDGDALLETIADGLHYSEMRDRITELEADRDSETRWANQYHLEAEALRARIAALEAAGDEMESDLRQCLEFVADIPWAVQLIILRLDAWRKLRDAQEE